MAEASVAYARPARMAGRAAKAKAASTYGPMPGTLRWIMSGMMLMPAPTIAHTPVAVSPRTPIPRASVGRDGRAVPGAAISFTGGGRA